MHIHNSGLAFLQSNGFSSQEDFNPTSKQSAIDKKKPSRLAVLSIQRKDKAVELTNYIFILCLIKSWSGN